MSSSANSSETSPGPLPQEAGLASSRRLRILAISRRSMPSSISTIMLSLSLRDSILSTPSSSVFSSSSSPPRSRSRSSSPPSSSPPSESSSPPRSSSSPLSSPPSSSSSSPVMRSTPMSSRLMSSGMPVSFNVTSPSNSDFLFFMSFCSASLLNSLYKPSSFSSYVTLLESPADSCKYS